jgi:hypothetical protein
VSWQAGPHPDDAPRPPVVVEEPVRPFPRRQPVVMRPRARTPQVSALQLLLPVALGMMSVLFARGWSLTTIGALMLLTALIQGLVARRDRRRLTERGFAGLPSSAVALLSSALYLRLRGRACEGHDPSARDDAGWAIGTTIAAAVLIVLGTGFQLAIGGLFEAASG